MNVPRTQAGVLAIFLVMAGVACGHKGPPQAPLRPIPAAMTRVSIERAGTAVTLRFTVPEANLDGSTPPAVERIDVYGLSRPADAPRPTPVELMLPANLLTTIHVRSEESATPGLKTGGSSTTPGPKTEGSIAPGDEATYVETLAAVEAGGSPPTVRYYAAAPTAGRRRGPPSAILRVPLSGAPAAPSTVKVDYTEQTLTVGWQPGAAGQQFMVDETDETGAHAKRVSSSLLDAATFDLPVQFGQARCFVVRAVDHREAVSIVGAPASPVCITPVDRFPPPAPTALLALPAEAGVELVWTASSVPDLAGYIVLRGEDVNGTLQPLMTAPIAVTTYKDESARSGVTYAYAVIALDKAAPPNASGPSNRVIVTARLTPARVRHER